MKFRNCYIDEAEFSYRDLISISKDEDILGKTVLSKNNDLVFIEFWICLLLCHDVVIDHSKDFDDTSKYEVNFSLKL
jgi:hypothetical protein